MDKEEIKVAVDLLVNTENYAALKREIHDLINTRETLPRKFAGGLTPLNALLQLDTISPEAFANVINLVEARRAVTPGTSKVDYQRDYMRQRRTRLATALHIEELERGKALSPTARKAFKDRTMHQWMQARDKYIEARGELTWKERNDVAGEFWEKMDTQLERQLVDARLKRKK